MDSPSSRCTTYSSAVSFPLKKLVGRFSAHHEVSWFRDVIYVSCKKGDDPLDCGAFIFPYGAAVMWGLSPQQKKSILETLKKDEDQPYEVTEKESYTYIYGSKAAIANDQITLPSSQLEAKLAFSHGLAQSIKLSVFEGAAQKTIAKTKDIPAQLAKHGKISLSRKQIRKMRGSLFIERSSINLHFDVLDVPEYFWEHFELEPIYTLIANYLDLETRVEILNQRLDVIHDLFEVLGNELNHQHSSRLEWIIILLIAIEVVSSFVREIF